MTVEWKDGGSEPLVWSTNGAGTWCAVWPQRENFAAWVLPPSGPRRTSAHPTEAAAKAWCEAEMVALAPFVCSLCGLASSHPRDKAERFCAVCGFVDDVLAARALRDEKGASDA